MINVCEFVPEARKVLGYTQEEFTEEYNKAEPASLTVTRGLLAKYETGEVVPPATKFLKIRKVLRELKAKKLDSLNQTK